MTHVIIVPRTGLSEPERVLKLHRFVIELRDERALEFVVPAAVEDEEEVAARFQDPPKPALDSSEPDSVSYCCRFCQEMLGVKL